MTGQPARTRRRSPRLSFALGALGVGALFLPLAFLGILRLLLTPSLMNPRSPLSDFIRSAHEAQAAIETDSTGRLMPRPGYRAPPGLDLVVTDTADRVVFSSLPGLPVGSLAEPAALSRVMRSFGARRSFIGETANFGAGTEGLYYAFLTKPPAGSPTDPALPLMIPAGLMGMAVIAFLLGSLAAAKIASEVSRLRRAAGRIAGGDLETAIAAGGFREIADLAGAMDAMRNAIREDLARRSRFLAAVSHDLRTPLTSIAGYLEAIEDGLADDPATLRRYVAIMREKAGLLEGRIAGLLDFARIETEEWRLRFEEVALGPMLASILLAFGDDAALLGKRVETSLGALDGLRVRADRALLARALENILSNALRYTPPAGCISVSARRESGLVNLDIDDEGPGIPRAERELVFEPFYRGSHAREGEGSGLGLYIARSIVRGHGWELVAGASVEGGGRLRISIPLER